MKQPAFKKLILAGGAAFAMLAVPMAANTIAGLDLGVISAAQAAEHSGGAMKGGAGGSGGAKKGAKKGGEGKGGAGKGGAASNKIFRVPVGEEDDDSDRPIWAGVPGGPADKGGRPEGSGTKKGDLFGDMVMLLRDDNGEPILDDDGLVQVLAFTVIDGQVVPLMDDGVQVVIPRNEEGDLLPTVVVDGVTYTVSGVEVDLGRLSVGRSPTSVLKHALDEALSKLTADGAVITIDATGRLVVDGKTIDSPLENLALYEVIMSSPDGTLPGVTLPEGVVVDPAALFAAAADKTGTITVDTVVYMNSILGINNLKSGDYYDFSAVDYDRAAAWSDVTVTVLVLQPDGVTYKAEDVNVYDTLFDADGDGDGDTWVDSTAGGADDFAQSADDYLQVLEFVHDNAVR